MQAHTSQVCFLHVLAMQLLKLPTNTQHHHQFLHSSSPNASVVVMIMARLTVVAATFAVLMLVVNGSIVRTIVTEIEEEGLGQSKWFEMQKNPSLSHCQSYLTQSRQSELIKLRSVRTNRQEEHLQQCCSQLRRIDEQRRCDELEAMAQEQKRRYQGQEMQEMMETARNLPSTCNLPPFRCEFRTVSA